MADERVDLSGAHLQVDGVEREGGAEALAQVPDAQQWRVACAHHELSPSGAAAAWPRAFRRRWARPARRRSAGRLVIATARISAMPWNRGWRQTAADEDASARPWIPKASAKYAISVPHTLGRCDSCDAPRNTAV